MSNTCSNNHFRSPTILKYALWNFHLELCVLRGKKSDVSGPVFQKKTFLKICKNKSCNMFLPTKFLFPLVVSICKVFAGFIFILWTARECTVTKGHVFSLKDVRWTAGHSTDHCGIAPGQGSRVGCTSGECTYKDQAKADSRESARRR